MGVLVKTREFADSSKILLSSFWLTSFDFDDVTRLFPDVFSDWELVESMLVEWACDDVAADLDDDAITTVLVTFDDDVMVRLLLWIFSTESVWLSALCSNNLDVRVVRVLPIGTGDGSASSVMGLIKKNGFSLVWCCVCFITTYLIVWVFFTGPCPWSPSVQFALSQLERKTNGVFDLERPRVSGAVRSIISMILLKKI